MKELKFIAISTLGFSALFGVFSLLLYFGEWPRLFAVTGMGFFIGLVTAPLIEPKSFRYAWQYQIVSGALSGLFIAWLLSLSFVSTLFAAFIGSFLGWSSQYWVKHVRIP